MAIPGSTEKIFFNYILINPKYFSKVKHYHFNNSNISQVFELVKKHFEDSKKIPSGRQIQEIVRINDPSGESISDSFVEQLLTIDMDEYVQDTEDGWLESKFKAWNIENGIKDRLNRGIDAMRKIQDQPGEMSYEKISKVANKLREIIGDSELLNFDDGDMGLDFFSPEHHQQESSKNKILTGWTQVDDLLQGGWDRKTLNVFMGGSNTGKSLWMGNTLSNMLMQGKNCAFISLEMSDRKVMKRIGSNLLQIPINQYDELSKDPEYIQKRIQSLRNNLSHGGLGSALELGNLYVKEYPAGTLTIYELDAYIKKLKEKKNTELDVVAVDYIGLMDPSDSESNLYKNGKKIAEGLRMIAQKYNLVMITASQVSRDASEANTMSMKDIADSRAIYETADNIFGIIRNEVMKRDNTYILKLLKIRDGEFKWSRCKFDLDPTYLKILNDCVIE